MKIGLRWLVEVSCVSLVPPTTPPLDSRFRENDECGGAGMTIGGRTDDAGAWHSGTLEAASHHFRPKDGGRVFLAGDKPQRYVFFLSTMPRSCLARTRAVLAIQAQAVVASGSASMF